MAVGLSRVKGKFEPPANPLWQTPERVFTFSLTNIAECHLPHTALKMPRA
jgi:hypothetical protein